MTKEGNSGQGVRVDPVSYENFMQREYSGCSSDEKAPEPVKQLTPEQLRENGQGRFYFPED